MNTIPNRPATHQRASGRNTHFSREFSRIPTPANLPRRDVDWSWRSAVPIPSEIMADGPSKTTARLIHQLTQMCFGKAQAGTFATTWTLATILGIPESTVRQSRNWLVELGWCSLEPMTLADGREVVMIWCLWLADHPAVLRDPAEDYIGLVSPIGDGFAMDLGTGEVVTETARPARFFAPTTRKPAPQTAPKSALCIEVNSETSNDNGSAALPRGEKCGPLRCESGPANVPDGAAPEVGSASASVDQVAASASASVGLVAFSAEEIAARVADLRSRKPKIVRRSAYWELAWRDQVPEDHATAWAEEFGPVPDREPEPAPQPAAPPRPKPLAEASPGSTLDQLRRLGPASSRDDVEAIADAICAEWNDWQFHNLHLAHASRIASGEIPPSIAAKHYQLARAASLPGSGKGRLYMGGLRKYLEKKRPS